MREFSRACGVALAAVAVLCAAAGRLEAAPAAKQQAQAEVSAGPIDLNTADEGQLTAVPGIGKVMAQRIIEWRKAHGPFQRVEDLMKVQGIGEKSLEKLRPYVTVVKAR